MTRRPTAEELQRKLRADPNYFARRRAEQIEGERLAREYREHAAPIVTELAAAGFQVRRIIELGRDGRDYRAVVPILLRWLPRVEHRKVLSDIVRALTDPAAAPEATQPLIEKFDGMGSVENDGIKWDIANAISEIADDAAFEAIAALIQDPAHGIARQQLVTALTRMTDRKAAAEVAIAALDDRQLTTHALEALRKLGQPWTVPDVERFRDDPDRLVRTEARRALKRLVRDA